MFKFNTAYGKRHLNCSSTVMFLGYFLRGVLSYFVKDCPNLFIKGVLSYLLKECPRLFPEDPEGVS